MSTPSYVIHKFWTEYKQDPADPAKTVGIDWVAYGPIGSDKNITRDRVSRLRMVQPLADSNSPAVELAHHRWNFIEKHYKAWKEGQEAPLTGTPLAAWNALSPEQADLMRVKGIKTVEDVAGMTDSLVTKFPIPNMRNLVKQAQMFIESADQIRTAARLTEKDEQIATLQAETNEQNATIASLMAKVNQLAEMVATAKQPEAVAEDAPAPAAEKPAKGKKAA